MGSGGGTNAVDEAKGMQDFRMYGRAFQGARRLVGVAVFALINAGTAFAQSPMGEAPAATPIIAAPAFLPRDLSPWGMFLSADIVVKVVMVGLVFASVVTWTVWLAKS